MTALEEARNFSEDVLRTMREAIAAKLPADHLVVTCGSFARRDASSSSDMDYYSVIESKGPLATKWDDQLKSIIQENGIKPPADGGAFATNVRKTELLRNYGGSKDTNKSITQRMLYLLEGDYLSAKDKFDNLRSKIIEKYVDNTPRDHQIAFYLLNDLVRYWRTITVDYADKTYGRKNKKPFGLRNIKLVYSRKLIYTSGLFSIALTADRTRDAKCEILKMLFSMSPVDRIKYVCGDESSRRLIEIYNYFIGKISDPAIRDILESLENDDERSRKDPTFRELKNEGHYFSREAFGLLQRTFHASHPIHMAVVF